MQKGIDASAAIRSLLAERHWKIVDLAGKTGIGAGTLAAYATRNPDARRPLGLVNGRKIAAAFGVDLSRLGLSEEAEAGVGFDPYLALRELEATVSAMKKTQAQLVRRVKALEQWRAELPPRYAAGEVAS